jgi:gliding motility-associated-like protein
MKKKKKLLALVALLFLSYVSIYSQTNLIVNGDFEITAPPVNYTVSVPYNFTVNTTTNMRPGQYTVGTTTAGLNLANTNNNPFDHTSGTGNMLIVDGVNPSVPFWTAGNSTTSPGDFCAPGSFTVGLQYTFSYWRKGISNNTQPGDPGSRPNIALTVTLIGATTSVLPVTLVSGNPVINYTNDPVAPGSAWEQVVYTFTVPAGDPTACLKMELRDITTAQGGNDFAVDDISLVPCVPVTPTFNAVGPICSGDTTITGLPLSSTNVPPITGAWAPAFSNTVGQTYTFTPDANQCATTQTLAVVVTPSITPTFDPVGPICSGDTTITGLPLSSTNVPPITGAWAPAFSNTVGQTYTFTPDANQCATTQILAVVVTPSITPTFDPVDPICSGDTTITGLPLMSTNVPPITGAWAPAFSNTVGQTYTFTPDANQCATTQTLAVVVTPNITPTFAPIPDICEGDMPNLPPTSIEGITGTWEPNPLTANEYIFTPNPNQCAGTGTLTVNEIPKPELFINDPTPVCTPETVDITDASITNGTPDLGTLTYWLDDAGVTPLANPTTITETGFYYIQNTFNGCTSDFTPVYVEINNATLTSVQINVSGQPFSGNQNVEVIALDENGIYTYQLDDNTPQFENVFTNVPPGFHTVIVTDIYGCSIPIEESFLIIDYPKFFTPNSDGFNDKWNVIGLNDQPKSRIYIFDRYGKLIKQIAPAGQGWDGTYNGKSLPGDDYWFKLEYENKGVPKEFKAHFALKR